MDDVFLLGLAGEAGTGKTSTGNLLAPTARVDTEDSQLWWEHAWFAMPLYEIVSVKQKIRGDQEWDRQAYEIHRVFTEIFGNPLYGAPSYDELVELVYETCAWPIPEEGKPREFMQWLGTDVCRARMEDCFVRWMRNKVSRDFYPMWRREHSAITDCLGIVLTDVRFENEIDFINRHGVVIRLTCDDEERAERLSTRDGTTMNALQQNHSSETQLNNIDPSKFHAVVDTTGLSIAVQAQLVESIVRTHLNAV